jgi:hypothetical protein
MCRLPLPWFLYTVVFMESVPVRSDGMVCSITLLFLMLILVFLSILTSNWKMTKGKFIMLLFLVLILVFLSILTSNWKMTKGKFIMLLFLVLILVFLSILTSNWKMTIGKLIMLLLAKYAYSWAHSAILNPQISYVC